MKSTPLNSCNTINNASKRMAILIYIVVSLFLVYEMAVQVSPSVMAPKLMHDLSFGPFTLGIMSSFYFYSYSAMQIPSGLLFDRFTPRKIIVSAVVICAIGAILFGATTNIVFGCLARLLMGAGSAFAFVSVLVMAATLFQSKWFPFFTGITQMLAALGAMSGQLPLNLLVNTLGWRDTMFVLGFLGLCLAILIFFLLSDVQERLKESLDLKVVTNKQPIKADLTFIIKNRQTWFVAIYACVLWAPMSGFASLWGVPFLTVFDHLSNNAASFLCSLMWLGLAIGSPIFGIFATKLGNKKIPMIISAAIGLVSFSILLILPMRSFALEVCLFLSGVACAGQAISFGLVSDQAPLNIKATAIAFNNMAVVISGVIFQPLIGAIVSFSHSGIGISDSVSAYRNASFVILVAYGIAVLVGLLFIKEKNQRISSNYLAVIR